MRDLLIEQFHVRVFDENFSRIFKCLDMLTEEAVWWSPNASSNSIGNLILHLIGNARQWIGSGIGQLPDDRDRPWEFNQRNDIDKNGLKQRLEALKETLTPILANIEDEDLSRVRPVQIYEENGVSILVHVIEHFSYHTGQIALLTKIIKDQSLGFYDEDALA